MTFRKRIKEISREANRPQIYRGRLAEDYDGIGQFVLVSLSQSSTGGAYKARVASGDFGTEQSFPAGTLVTVSVKRGRLEVMSLGNKSQGGGGTVSAAGISPMVIGWDNGTAALTTSVNAVEMSIESDCTILKWTLLGTPVSGSSASCTVEIETDDYTNYPPTIADKITGSNPPSFSGTIKGTDDVLSGWSPGLSAGNTIRFVLTAVSNLKFLSLTLKLE